MNRYLTLGLAALAAFLFAALSAGITVGHGQNITELQAGLLLACVAIIFLTVRLYFTERRLSALERLVAGEEEQEEQDDDDPSDEE